MTTGTPAPPAVATVTIQAAQVAGFAAGGALVAAVGSRQALAVDAATFAVSALAIRLAVRARPPAAGPQRRSTLATLRAGTRLVFG
jgi:hypothetical protein